MDKDFISARGSARTAGMLYLVVIITGVFAKFIVRSRMVVEGDSAATALNILSSEGLYRLGFVSDLLMQTAYFFLPLVLYIILKQVNKNQARLMVLCVLVAVSIMCLNMLNHLAALLLLNGTVSMETFNPDQVNELVMFFLNMHANGYHIAQIFFGLWLLPLGLLIHKSPYFPKILGILLVIGSAGYLLDFLAFFLLPDYKDIITPIVTTPSDIAELSLCLWLLIKGIRRPK